MINYDLGIVWSIGSWEQNKRFTFTSNSEYHIQRMQILFKNAIYSQQGNTGIQYRLRTSQLDIRDMLNIGYTKRNSSERDLPILEDYKDFLRAYMELHATFSWQTTYKTKSQEKYYRLRMRIFGNQVLLDSINRVFIEKELCQRKSFQKVTKNSGYLQFTAVKEIDNIIMWLQGSPSCIEYWDNAVKLVIDPVKIE